MLEDLKSAWRRLRHFPGFTAIAVLTLALAIGANSAIFSIADAVLFRPLPYADPDSLFIIQMMNRKTASRYTLTPTEYLGVLDEHHGGLGRVALVESAPSLTVVTPDGAEAVRAAAVTGNYFGVVGVGAARGRLLDQSDEGQPARAAVLSYAAWQQRFAGDETIVGRSVTLGGVTFDIVGVLPHGFMFPSVFGGRPEVVTVMPPPAPDPQQGVFHPVVRLEPGVTREQAQAEIEALILPLAARDPRRADSVPVLDDVRSVLFPVGRPVMTLLLVASALVLLIGCANLANMLLARQRRSERETGLRSALGASRARLVLPVIFEAAMIGLAGAIVAVSVTAATSDALLRHVPRIVYGNAPVGVDLRVVLHAIVLGLAAGFVFAVVPAWRSAGADVTVLVQGRRRASRRAGRIGRPMVAVQVALALVLVFGAVIAGRAFLAVLSVPLGFDPDGIVTVRVAPQGDTGAARQAFYVRVLETARTQPDIVAAGAVGSLPLSGVAPDEGVVVPGADRSPAGIVHVLPGYFETIGMRVIRGRAIGWDDVRGNPDAALVSETAARALFPGRDPLGQTFGNGRGRTFTVVGVVTDVRSSLDRQMQPPAYVIPSDATRRLTIVAKTRAGGNAVLADIKRDASRLAPATPVSAEWWSDSIRALTAYRNPRFQALVLGTFAALALVLTGLGVFGVVAFLVVTRVQEMGVRLALGASAGSVVWLVVRQTLSPVAAGLLLGLLATRWTARLAEAQLFEVETGDPITLAASAAVIVSAALLAVYLPARRAGAVDPIVVLRSE